MKWSLGEGVKRIGAGGRGRRRVPGVRFEALPGGSVIVAVAPECLGGCVGERRPVRQVVMSLSAPRSVDLGASICLGRSAFMWLGKETPLALAEVGFNLYGE